jgi:3'-phosphoadenosine 5'-phosphosulfate sulfotransferase (PAPS reductase)/FAD synthetase
VAFLCHYPTGDDGQTMTAPITAPERAREQLGLAHAESMIADAVAKHSRVALLYSGGIESALLLRLIEPWRQQITVYTVRTGAEFPHMVAFMDRKLAHAPGSALLPPSTKYAGKPQFKRSGYGSKCCSSL